MGEMSVSDSERTEGEQFAALDSFEFSPFGHSHPFVSTFPVNGESFWVVLPPACPERGGGCECNEQPEGLKKKVDSLGIVNPSVNS